MIDCCGVSKTKEITLREGLCYDLSPLWQTPSSCLIFKLRNAYFPGLYSKKVYAIFIHFLISLAPFLSLSLLSHYCFRKQDVSEDILLHRISRDIISVLPDFPWSFFCFCAFFCFSVLVPYAFYNGFISDNFHRFFNITFRGNFLGIHIPRARVKTT